MSSPPFIDPPIIEVRLSPGGQLDYRLRTSVLSTKDYGEILACLARQIGAMMQIEGGLIADKVTAEIVVYFEREIERPTAAADIHQLQ